MKACFLIAECNLSYAKVQLFSNTTAFPCRKTILAKGKSTKCLEVIGKLLIFAETLQGLLK